MEMLVLGQEGEKHVRMRRATGALRSAQAGLSRGWVHATHTNDTQGPFLLQVHLHDPHFTDGKTVSSVSTQLFWTSSVHGPMQLPQQKGDKTTASRGA